MSEENVQVAKQAYDAFGRGDMQGVFGSFHTDVEWHAAEGLPWGGVHRGSDAVRENVFGSLMAAFDDFALEIEQFIDGGNYVVALGRYSAKAKKGGTPLDAAFAHVWEFEGGKLKRYYHYTDTVKFREALS